MQDSLFIKRRDLPFCFDKEVVAVFEDMIERSVPYYKEVTRMTVELMALRLRGQKALVYDLGCSHGELLYHLIQGCDAKHLTFIGVDSSKPMIEKAKEKLNFSFQAKLELYHASIEDLVFQACQGIMLNYTLQFVSPSHRARIINTACQALEPGGVLILSEKVTCDNPLLRDEFITHYHAFKSRNQYSDVEIQRKQKALKSVLIPFTPQAYRTLLEQAGFQSIETFFRWYNFISFIAVKENRASTHEE